MIDETGQCGQRRTNSLTLAGRRLFQCGIDALLVGAVSGGESGEAGWSHRHQGDAPVGRAGLSNGQSGDHELLDQSTDGIWS